MAEKMQLGADTVWLKEYDPRVRRRRAALAAWNALTHALGAPLLAAPHYAAAEARRRIELRRITALDAAGVRVPRVLAHGKRHLLLADLGPSLSRAIKACSTAMERERHIVAGLRAIAAAHAAGAYLGQPYPRNMTWDGTAVGFIDFEDDPRTIIDLPQCQARDWLLYCHGVARYFVDHPAHLGALLRDAASPVLDAAARRALARTAHRLRFLTRLPWRAAPGAAPVAAAVHATGVAFPPLAEAAH